MAKTKISEFDSNPANNTDIDGINLAEGMAPGLVNNAIRELMAQLKDLQAGLAGDNFTVGGNLVVTGTGTLGGRAIDAFPSGTKMLFAQTSAPTGWVKDTTHDNKALRVVSGTAGSGGTVAFTTAFASQNVGGTALTQAQLPAHTHTYSGTTGNQSADHTHSGTTGGHSNDHSHFFSANTSAVGDHAHGFGTQVQTQENGSGPFYVSNGVYQYGLITATQGAGAHSHSVSGNTGGVSANHTHAFTTGGISSSHNHTFSGTTSSIGSGSTHTHLLNIDVAYVDVIICTKS